MKYDVHGVEGCKSKGCKIFQKTSNAVIILKRRQIERKRQERINKSIAAMHKTLMFAIEKAGGSGHSFTLFELTTMTVFDLMKHLAPNGIRFVYRGKRA